MNQKISGPEIESKEWGQVDFLLSVTSQLTSNFFFLLGYYCDALALTEPTGLCTAGFYCLTGSTTDSPNECPIGKYCPEGRWFYYYTRMHSSRMRTVRSSSRLLGGGVSGPGGVPARGVCLVWEGVYLVLYRGGVPAQWVGGGTWSGGVPGPGGYLVLGVYLVWGVYLVPGGCTWSRGCTCSWGVYLVWGYLVWEVSGRGVTWSRGCTWSCGGVPGPVGVYLVPGGTWSCGGCTCPGGCTWSGGSTYAGTPPPLERMTDTCKNITFATSLRTVKSRVQRGMFKGETENIVEL